MNVSLAITTQKGKTRHSGVGRNPVLPRACSLNSGLAVRRNYTSLRFHRNDEIVGFCRFADVHC